MNYFTNRCPWAFLMLLCCICSNVLGQSTIVVNPGGSIQTAVNSATPGTTIQVTAGTYTQKVLFSSKNGTSGNYITLKADPGVILSGTGLTPAGREGLITITNSSYVRIEGFDIQNFITSGGNTPVGILVQGSGTKVQIVNNKIHNIRNNSTCKDPCGEGAHGLGVFGTSATSITDILIQGNEIYSNVLQASESLVVNGNVDRFEVLNNNVHDNNNIGYDFIGYEGECSGCGDNDRVRNGMVRGNISTNNSSTTNPWYSNTGSAGGFYVDGGQFIVFERNISTGNDLGFEFASEHPNKATEDILMMNNYVYNNKDVGIALGGYASGLGESRRIQVYNNSFYKDKGFGTEVTLQYKVINCQFANNIFFGEATAAESYESIGTGSTGNVWGKNIWWGTSNASTGLPGTLVVQNPLYTAPATGNLKIQTGSPAIDAGSLAADITTWTSPIWDLYFPPSGNIPANGLVDINGEARIESTIDLGADEFGTSGGTVTIPSAPSALAATTNSSSQITLTWTDNASNETGFSIERSLTSGSGYAQIATVGSNVTTYANSGLTAATTYYYRVTATNSAGASAYSNVANATTQSTVTIPAAPTSLTATANSSTQITLTWTDNANNETGFSIERSLTSGSGYAQIATVGSNVTTYANSGLTAATTYYYRVTATNSAGASAYSNVANATTQATTTIPTAPSSLTATANSSSQITLTWVDNATNETGFSVERSLTSGSGYAQIATVGSNITTYANSGLTASTTYYYRVTATNSAGASAYSNVANATTAAGSGITITVDGNAADWASVSAISTSGAGGLTTLKAYSDATNLYVLAQGTTNTNYSIFINKDNVTTTGFTAGLWSPEGSDYSLENGTLYKYNGTGTNWSWTTSGVTQTGISAVKNSTVIEVKIPKANIASIAATIKLGVDVENSSWTTVATIPAQGGAQATYVLGNARTATQPEITEEGLGVSSLYPNPSSGIVKFSYYVTEPNQQLGVHIISQTGAQAKEFSFIETALGQQEKTLHLHELENGLYLMKIRLGNRLTTQRFLISK